jgi:thiamine-monophosphate kinase
MSKGVFSDEPSRVAQLVETFFTGQSGSVVSTGELPTVVLAAGADKGDDCAVYDISGPVTLVAGSDYVRGPKFALYELGILTEFDIGYYLVAANLSDIAAMGALPIGMLTVVRYPKELDDAEFIDLMAGIHQACTDHATLNVGGDIGNAERIILSGSAIGICERGKTLSRATAQPGDLLCVTGSCGVLGAAVAYFPKRDQNGWSLDDTVERALLEGWRRPRARIAEGRILSSRGYGTSCQDTSDGLKATIEQIAVASGVGFEVFADAIMVPPGVAEVARLMGVDPLTLSLSASSDFQLAFTIRPSELEDCSGEFAKFGLEMRVIGSACSAEKGVSLVDSNGERAPLPGVAWRHQGGDISNLVVDRAARRG